MSEATNISSTHLAALITNGLLAGGAAFKVEGGQWVQGVHALAPVLA